MTRYPVWFLVGAAIVGVLVAVLLVIPSAEVKQDRGTAPSTLDTQRTGSPCARLPEADREACYARERASSPR
jgi:hypothetical protein